MFNIRTGMGNARHMQIHTVEEEVLDRNRPVKLTGLPTKRIHRRPLLHRLQNRSLQDKHTTPVAMY